MNNLPRRENGITVRFLAQSIFNDSLIGADKFVEKLANKHGVSKGKFQNLNSYFFLHLEDYGVGDKSEIDFVLWNEHVILPVEVKAFSDANSPSVKKEIIRNYLHVNELKNRAEFNFTQD